MIYEKIKVDEGYLIKFCGERSQIHQYLWHFSNVKNKIFSAKYTHYVFNKEGVQELNVALGIGMDSDIANIKKMLAMKHVITDYETIGKEMLLEPYDYQKEVIKYLIDNNGGLVVAPCGSGKSPIGIGTYLEAKSRGIVQGPGIIVVKASLKVQWVREVSKFSNLTANSISTKASHCAKIISKLKRRESTIKKLESMTSLPPKDQKRLEKAQSEIIPLVKEIEEHFLSQFRGYDILVLNYETVNDDEVQKTLLSIGADYIMADEIHYIKSRTSVRSKSMAKLNKIPFRVGATATPVGKSPEDLFGIFRFVEPTIFPNYSKFSERYLKFYGGAKYGRVSGAQNIDELVQKIHEKMVVKSKEAVSSQLPKLVVTQLVCNLTEKQQVIHDILQEELDELHEQENAIKSRMRSEEELRSNQEYQQISAGILARQTFAQQLCTDETMLMRSDSEMAKKYVTGDHNEKMDLLLDKVEEILEEGEKVCIFSRYTTMQDILTERFAKSFPEAKIAYIRGDLSAEDRYVEAYDKFRDDPDYKILLMSNAGSEGLNLSRCKYMIEIERAESYGIQTQRFGRLERADSIHDTAFVYQLVCENSWDDVAQKIVNKKQKYDEELIRL